MDTCICMAELLCCVPETATTLLIGYTPIWNKKLKKKKVMPALISKLRLYALIVYSFLYVKKILRANKNRGWGKDDGNPFTSEIRVYIVRDTADTKCLLSNMSQ